MSHGVGPLYLTAPNPDNPDSSLPVSNSTTPEENVDSEVLGVGSGSDKIGDTTLKPQTAPVLQQIYWNYLDEDWAADTQTTVAVFTTPAASVGGQSLNPLSKVDEENFVTADGAKYLERSGIRESAKLGKNLSWVLTPAEVGSQRISFLGNQTTMRTYVGYVTTDDSEIPRTVLVNLAKTETGDDIAFGVSVQHRAMYSLGGTNAVAPSDQILSGMSVPDLIGTEPNTGLNVSAADFTLILEAGVAASADRAATAMGSLSLA